MASQTVVVQAPKPELSPRRAAPHGEVEAEGVAAAASVGLLVHKESLTARSYLPVEELVGIHASASRGFEGVNALMLGGKNSRQLVLDALSLMEAQGEILISSGLVLLKPSFIIELL